jgi:hypothetical protein
MVASAGEGGSDSGVTKVEPSTFPLKVVGERVFRSAKLGIASSESRHLKFGMEMRIGFSRQKD